jgi:hypothetical protein
MMAERHEAAVWIARVEAVHGLSLHRMTGVAQPCPPSLAGVWVDAQGHAVPSRRGIVSCGPFWVCALEGEETRRSERDPRRTMLVRRRSLPFDDGQSQDVHVKSFRPREVADENGEVVDPKNARHAISYPGTLSA